VREQQLENNDVKIYEVMVETETYSNYKHSSSKDLLDQETQRMIQGLL